MVGSRASGTLKASGLRHVADHPFNGGERPAGRSPCHSMMASSSEDMTSHDVMSTRHDMSSHDDMSSCDDMSSNDDMSSCEDMSSHGIEKGFPRSKK